MPHERTDTLSLHSFDDLDGTATDGGRSPSATSFDHDGVAVLHAARLTRVQSVGLLVPGPSDLHASTSTAPDSLVDPDMSHLGRASTAARPAGSSTSSTSRRASSSGVAWPSRDGPASRADLAGLGLPTPPSSSSSGDPFERAFSLGVGPTAPARSRSSVLGSVSATRQEDDTSSSFGSGRPSSMAYLDTTMPFEAAARSPPSSMLSGSSVASHRDVTRPRPASRSSRTSFPAPPGRPLSQHIIVDFPAVPPRSYSPDVPRPRSADEHAATAPRPPLLPSPPRSTLALRRSAHHLPPLLPSSSTSSPARHLSIPSPAALTPSSSPDSPASPSQIPFITRSNDGFYRLPVTPSSATSHSVGRTRRERQSTSDLAFPLPPVPDSATHLLVLEGAGDSSRWPASQYRPSSSSAVALSGGGPTPSPTTRSSLPTSPPPTSPPPPLPDFVSLFLDGPPRDDSASSSASSSLDSEHEAHARTRYPPAPSPAAAPHRQSHARAQDSLSSAVPGPSHRLSLRQRAVGAPGEVEPGGAEGGRGGGGARDRLDAWLRGVAPARPPSGSVREKEREGTSSGAGGGAGSGRVRWAERAAPGWSLRSDPARWAGERAQDSGRSRVRAAWHSRRVRFGTALALVVVLLLVVGLAVGLSRRAPVVAAPAACNCEHGGSARTTSDGGCYCACSSAWGGTSCHLNATCVGGVRAPVAQGLLDVAEAASALWEPKVDSARLGELLEAYFVPSSSSSSCQAQLALLVLPNLPSSTFPSRLAWAESALVHTLALTESNSTLSQLRTFASALSFAPFGDAPASKPNSNYQVIAGGWTWDFAFLRRSATGDWASVVKPSSDSSVRLAAAPGALAALDRLAPVAAAASAQRSKALEHYWATVLRREPDELQAFREAVQRAEVVVPLDAAASVGGGASMVDVAQAQSGAASFPPAVGCWAGLSETVVERVNAVEVEVFGLSAVSSSQSLDSSCLNRPLYGVLNLLKLRLPFPSSDKRSSLPQQSLVLKSSAVTDRVTVHASELLAAGPLAAAPTSPSLPVTPERFGLLSRLDHVLLDLLNTVSTAIANDLVDYVLSSPSGPPSPSTCPSLLDNSLPLLEVQLWGGLQYDDADLARSSLVAGSASSSSAAATSLFFGSSAGDAWRSWALSNTQHASLSRVEWADAAERGDVVVDQGRGGTAFEGVWARAASGSLKTSATVWTALQGAGLVAG
ncbi:uncharacterized protein RHOBADRAFT_56028 [Rhodotorula graminis WP1]|uniref:Uncharacterized protein n=1 Tax=Rhodotorula graminis (strain WP1) TaxID=578459 RepID=A0A0P9GXP1_RHOGW|nr:uncharacterized protein RHOBADRAFT_56028 [Rhodotorula graminis WP1]KPV72209.1 hypothetical protein RHOBADRAFT_56028 [Rhodotorula graminis WP1]